MPRQLGLFPRARRRQACTICRAGGHNRRNVRHRTPAVTQQELTWET